MPDDEDEPAFMSSESPGVVLPLPDRPQLTVVVLAWRMTDPLIDCLRAVAGGGTHTNFEVVLVLNGAGDPVRQVVDQHVRGGVIVDSPVNLGFAAGANTGASRARGRHLLFLNDDTVVRPGCIDALLAAIERSADVGAVGPLLLFPDGRVQSAGCRLLSDGGVDEVARGAATLASELAQPREVDFASGAALLVRREAFEWVGGYDTVFNPAYFEDVDLALRLRSCGWRIVYEPAAVAVHIGSASTEADPLLREFAYRRSEAIFRSRWHDVLANAPTREDPLDVLCRVPILPSAVASDAPARVPAEPVLRAFELNQEYARWLAEKLRGARAELDEGQRQRDALSAELAELSERTRVDEQARLRAEAVVVQLQQRWANAEQPGLRALLAWRARLWLRRHQRVGRIVRALLRRS